MLGLLAILTSASLLFAFGISSFMLILVAMIMLIAFIITGTITFIFKFGIWIILIYIAYLLFQSKKE